MSRLEKAFIIGVLVVLTAATWLFTTAFLGADEGTLAGERTTLEAHEGSTSAPRRVVGEASRPGTEENGDVEEVVAAPVELPPLENRITGTVTDAGGPVAGAAVKSKLFFPVGEKNYGLLGKHEATATTLEDGTFALEVPGHGAYRVTVTDSAHAAVVREPVRAGEDLVITMAAGARIEGVVRSKPTKKPVPDAHLVVTAEGMHWKAEVTAGDDGTFALSGLPGAPLELKVSRTDYVRYEKRLELDAGALETLVVDLDPGRAIKGTVEDEEGTRIENATVKAGDVETVTDDLGRFRLAGLGRRSHYVRAEADGFITAGLSVNLAGSRLEADIEIVVKPGGSVTGSVIDDTGKPVPGASVKVFRSWGRSKSLFDTGSSRFASKTDSDGRFEITGLHANRWNWYSVRVLKEGYAECYSERFRLEKANEEKEIPIVMRPGGVIAGAVLDEQERPIAGAKVTLSPAHVHEWNRSDDDETVTTKRELLTDSDGRYAFTRLGKGSFRVSALARGYASRFSSEIKIEAEELHEGVDLTLARGGKITGKVTSTDGEPVENARLWFYSSSSWAMGRSGPDGSYVVNDVLEGTFTATVRAEGYRYKRERNAVAIEGMLDFQLDPNGAVTGKVTDAASGEALAGCGIELIQPGENGRRARTRGRARTEADGTFAVHAPDGSYVLRARMTRYIPWEKTEVQLAAGTDVEPLAIELEQGGAIEGWVEDDLGEPVDRAEVYVRSSTSGGTETFRRTGQTEKDGYFFIDSLGTGSYIVAIRKRGRSAIHQRRNVNVFAGEIAETRFSFLPPTRLLVALVDDRGKPLSRQFVKVRHAGADPIELVRTRNDRGDRVYELADRKSYRTSRNGTIVINDLPEGAYDLTVVRKHHDRAETTVDLREGRESAVQMTVYREGKRKPKKQE